MNQDSYSWFYSSDYYRRLYDSQSGSVDPEFIAEYSNKYSFVRYGFVKKHTDYDLIKSVLEIGCAGGWNLLPFHKDGKRVLGYDYGPRLVEAGRKLGMDLRIGSMEDLKEGSRYDLIILSHVVEHLLDPVGFISQLRGHLSEGGVFYVVVPNMEKFGMGQLQNAHTYYFTKETLLHYLKKAGLKPIVFQKDILASHMAGVFVLSDEEPPSLSNEARCMTRIVKKFERREQVKGALQKLGLYNLVRRIVRRR